jgi:2',3'-cyclic-nucleotide 2'-phosphodiesterase (5'-nucleotidase family)
LIVSGHTHTRLDKPIQQGDTYIVSCGEYGKYLGDLSMTQKENGRWEMNSYELVPITPAVAADEATQKRVDYFMSLVDDKYLAQFGYTKDQVLCTNEVPFSALKDLYNKHTEHNLGSIIADAYAYAVESAPDWDGVPVDVAVAPSGTIRDTYAMGNITVENVFNSFSLGIGEDGVPGYPLISVYLTGEELKLVAEVDSTVSDLMTSARLYTYGLQWSYNPNRMLLNKATDVWLVNRRGERVELEDDKLYRVVTDMYSALMLGGVTDMSFGLLSLIAKQADGTPVTDYDDEVVMVEGKEQKAWAAIATYMESFADADGDGVPNVPAVYGTTEGRKVVEDSKAIGDLIKNPNKFFWMILGIVALVIVILVAIVVLIVKLVKVIVRKLKTKRVPEVR